MGLFKINADVSNFKTFRALKKSIQSKAPHMDRGGYKQSRRVRGYIEGDREICCYEQVFLYIQKGLGWPTDDLKKVVKMIYSIQNREWDIRFPLYLAAFGDRDLKVAEKPFKTYSYKSNIIKTIEQLVGDEKAISTITLAQLDLNIKRPVKINRNDLVLIVSDNLEKLSISSDVKNKLLKHKHTYVIFIEKEVVGESLHRINFKMKKGLYYGTCLL